MPIRIEPIRLPDGTTVTPTPPVGGCWMTTADGALQPRDRPTAKAAGLDWPEPAAPSAAAAPVAVPAPAPTAAKAPAAAAPVPTTK